MFQPAQDICVNQCCVRNRQAKWRNPSNTDTLFYGGKPARFTRKFHISVTVFNLLHWSAVCLANPIFSYNDGNDDDSDDNDDIMILMV